MRYVGEKLLRFENGWAPERHFRNFVFLSPKRKNAAQILQKLRSVYGEECLSEHPFQNKLLAFVSEILMLNIFHLMTSLQN